MSDLESRVEALCTAPAGCAFLLVIEATDLPLVVAARPAIAVEAAAIAQAQLSPFRPDHDWTVATVLAQGPRLREQASRILSVPGAEWIFGPIDRAAQVWIPEDGKPPSPEDQITPQSVPTDWERYAQKPARRIFTSTLVDGTSSRIAAFAYSAGDWQQHPPIAQYALTISQDALIFEVEDAYSWHRLCAAYPTQGEDGKLVPDWSAVAHDWDGVHLTLGGLLASEQVRVESSAGWSEHQAWDAEQTLWLRWCFTSVEQQPDLSDFPEPPFRLDWPRWIHELQIERIRRADTTRTGSAVALTSEPADPESKTGDT